MRTARRQRIWVISFRYCSIRRLSGAASRLETPTSEFTGHGREVRRNDSEAELPTLTATSTGWSPFSDNLSGYLSRLVAKHLTSRRHPSPPDPYRTKTRS